MCRFRYISRTLMPLKDYESEILLKMFDSVIIGGNYYPVEKVAKLIKWKGIAEKYGVKKSFRTVISKLVAKGLVDDHGKSLQVASLTRLGVEYAKGMQP